MGGRLTSAKADRLASWALDCKAGNNVLAATMTRTAVTKKAVSAKPRLRFRDGLGGVIWFREAPE